MENDGAQFSSGCGDLTVDTFGSAFDTVLEVLSGDCFNLTSIACNDDSGGLQSSVTIPGAVPGQTFVIRVGGFGAATGVHNVNITLTPAPLPNADCVGAIAVGLGVNGAYSTDCATTSSPWPCANGGNDAWFSFTANCELELPSMRRP